MSHHQPTASAQRPTFRVAPDARGTLYASFGDRDAAVRAAGALVTHGVHNADLSLVTQGAEADLERYLSIGNDGDVGPLAVGLTSSVLPGLGLVFGGGAWAAALADAAEVAVAGGATGYLKAQGVPSHDLAALEHVLTLGGAVMALRLPSRNVSARQARELLSKYGAQHVGTWYRVL